MTKLLRKVMFEKHRNGCYARRRAVESSNDTSGCVAGLTLRKQPVEFSEMTFREHQAKAGKSGKGEAKRRSAEHYAAMVAARKAKQSAKQPVEEKKSEVQPNVDTTGCVSGNANV